MTMICFKEDNHTYTDEFNRVFTSVSNVIKEYKNPFRKKFWSQYKALQRVLGKHDFKKIRKKHSDLGFTDALIDEIRKEVDKDKFDRARREILNEWAEKNKKGIDRGNVYHDHMEKKAYKEGEVENPFTQETVPVVSIAKQKSGCDNVSLDDNLYNLEDGYYAELLLFNKQYQLAGQADRVFITTKDDERFVDIDDWKTNKKIRTTSHYDQDKKDYKRMNYPLHRHMDCNFIHYQLQISTYMWMLEQFGFTARYLSIHHHNDHLKMQYMRNDVENMLNDYFYFKKMDL